MVSASLLPNELHHGIDLTARIKPAWPVTPGQPSPRHYYRMSLGPYDTLQARPRPPGPLARSTPRPLATPLTAQDRVAPGRCLG